MMDLAARAHLSEWMDEACTYDDFCACLKDLAQVNRLTLAYRPTLAWLGAVAAECKAPLHIVDVGCGGGDMLRLIEEWARRKGIDVHLTGIDLNPYAARAAREMTPASSAIEWVTGDAFSYRPAMPIDLVISSLFVHHLRDEEIVRFVAWMEAVAVRGWFVNDLHRERFSYFGFQLLAKVMRWHRFVQHDGPVSIRRSFRREDWRRYLAQANIPLDQVQLDALSTRASLRGKEEGVTTSVESLIVGGGLAGSMVALELARGGRPAVVLEKSRGAHDKVCGEFLSREALLYLARHGIDVSALGGVPIRSVRMILRNSVEEAELPFAALSLTRRQLR